MDDQHKQRLADGQANLQAALEYLSMGWSVLALCPPDHVGITNVYKPHVKSCQSPGKRPWHNWVEYQDRLPTEEEVCGWWKKMPNSNVGIALGPVSKLIRIDIEGQSGEAKLQEMSGGDLPVTLEFTSGRDSGGRGFLYTIPDGIELKTTYEKPKPNEEVRFQAKGSQTVLPPSRHPSGRLYAWVEGHAIYDLKPATAPAWLLEKMAAKAVDKESRSVKDWDKILQGAPEGGRHDNMMIAMGGIISDIRDLKDSRSMQRAWQSSLAINSRNNPPLKEEELRVDFIWLWKKETAKRDEAESGGLDRLISEQIEAASNQAAVVPIIENSNHANGKPVEPAEEELPSWHLVIIKSEPPEYHLRSPFWKDSEDLIDGYLILSPGQILDWPRSIRKAALNQAQKIIPKKAEKWDAPDGHLAKLIENALLIETTPESKRKLYVLGFIYRYLSLARPARQNETDEPKWSSSGRPAIDDDGSIAFKLANLKKEVKNAKEDFLHREITRLLEEFGAIQCFICKSRWWRVSKDTLGNIGKITKESDL